MLRKKIFEMRRVGEEFYYLLATKVGIWSDMTSQEKPHGILLERRNAMIETSQIGPHVKKKKGHFDDIQNKDKRAADEEG